MPTKTTIDANAPILMQWIVSSSDRLNKEAEPGRHPLPNTQTFPHRQRLVNMAKVEPDRLICLYYLGDTLNEEQNTLMQYLENLAPNIRAINFNKLDWSEYDFEFNTSMLSVDDEGENMKMTEYLKLPNTDNRLGFRLDMMRILMLLKCPKAALLELNKVEAWDKPIGEGGIYFDFDFSLSSKMGKLKAPYGILSGYAKGVGNVYDFFFPATVAVTESKNPALTSAHENIKNCIGYDNDGSIKKHKLKFKYDTITFYAGDFLTIDSRQNDLVSFSVASGINCSVFAAASSEIQAKALRDNATQDLVKKNEICFTHAVNRNDAKVIVSNDAINGKEFHSWATSEDLDINKNFGSNTTYTEIFDMMYKAPELEIKNSISTNLKNIEQEQDKGYCRFQ
ncbi:MAG: hypothetical protein sL5_05530 [Candidatus Mesenet longicola]|uniref:Uncharacterized protein n=1 Tax=Candidatus Mesenet longicola TaxID=1892558 RepID=A0A8J3HVA7_9RICK|nr:MAG: hypothetical protein sGL2_05480 [Candidatus Mesenet longicola]GHM59560.1 MAG: hypothetical protein sL5_05530 [Candidatus Mesenet longicola]